MKKLIFLPLFVSFLITPNSLPAQRSPAASGVVQLTGALLPVRYFHESPISAISWMNAHNKFGPKWHTNGITIIKISYSWSAEIGGKRLDRTHLKIWVTKVPVEMTCKQFDVFVASEYPVGSCAYDVVLKHENTHVGFYSRIYSKYRALLWKELTRPGLLPTMSNPLVVGSTDEANQIIKARLKPIFERVKDGYERETKYLDGTIDTLANYTHQRTLCKQWKY